MKSVWIPLGSFALALCLSALSGAPRMAAARQSTGGTGCECKLEIMEQTGLISWKTETAATAALTGVTIQNSVKVCVGNSPKAGKWKAEWTATNLSVAFLAQAKGFQDVIDVRVVPIPLREKKGQAPCKPATDTLNTQHVHMSTLTKAAEAAILNQLRPNYPAGTQIKITLSAILLGTSFDTTVKASVDCGPTRGPLALSIPTYTAPKNMAAGIESKTETYSTSCP